MARNEDVNTFFWEDEDVDSLSDDAAFLYLWSFTNERCNMAGLYAVKSRHILEGRMTPARRDAALAELSERNFLYYADGWLWVRSRVKNLNTKGELMARSVINAINRVPAGHPLRAAFLTEYLENHWISKRLAEADFETPSNTLPNPSEGLQGKGKGLRDKEKATEKRKGPDPDALPDGFPAHLIPSARTAFKILRRTAEAKGSNPVTVLAVGRAIESRPDRDHAKVASDLEHWCCSGRGQNKPAKDIVARYRTFLDNADVVVQRPRRQAQVMPS